MLLIIIKLILLVVISDATLNSSDDNSGIVGGETIDIKDAPYQVAIIYKSRFKCGGSIISEDLVLSSAHCVAVNLDNTKYAVKAGSTIHKKESQVVKVKKIKYNENYDVCEYDVSLMRLEKPFKLSNSVKIITLASESGKLKEGDLCTVTGWGDTEPSPSPPYLNLSNKLRKMIVPIIENERCQEIYDDALEHSYNITENMICAGINGGGKCFSFADRGGPLVFQGQQFGIISWGIGSGQPKLPGVYASIPKLRKWIDENSKLV